MSEDAGRLVGGRYRLGDVLGRGGMGTVWRARDETLGRTVAVKELRFPSSVDEDEKQRLITRTLREAKAIARIRSGSAVTVFDVVDEDSRPWIVMELIEGHSLADQIKEDGPLSPQRAAEVGLAVLDVLRAAHREGILHRDVKPSNVLLEDVTGRVVLTDFGIAKVEGDPSVTSTGMLVGAPSYISPERARGKPPGPPADLWSLGGLLFAAVEGRPPYDKGSAISTLTAVMTEPVPASERAGELSEVIAGLLVKDPEKRLDVAGARVLLEPVAFGVQRSGADSGAASGSDATRTSVLPAVGPSVRPSANGASGSGSRSGGGHGGRRKRRTESGSSADRLRGALKSVRNAAASAGAGGATGAGTASGAASPEAPSRTPGSAKGPGSGSGARPGAPGGSSPVVPPARPAGPPSSAGTSGSVTRTPGQSGVGKHAAGAGGAGALPSSGTGASGSGPASGSAQGSAQGSGPGSASGSGERDGRNNEPTGIRGSRGGALPPESGGSGAITSLRDLRELPELRQGMSRRTLALIVAGVVALIVLIVVIVTTADGDDSDKGGDKAGSTSSAENAADETANRKGQDKGSEARDKQREEQKQDKSEKPDKPATPALPPGYKKTDDGRFHFAMAMPGTWSRTGIAGQNSGGKYAGSAGGLPKIQVDFNSSPTDDAAKAWRGLEPAVKGSSPGYHALGIHEVGWRGYPTVADWQFTRQENGEKVRVLNRGFKVDGQHGYAIMITCKAANWQKKPCTTVRETAFKTFKPVG